MNTLNSTWDQGITQYERGEYSAAQATLKEIDTLNPQFQAALSFERKAAVQPSHGTNGTPAATNGSGSQSGTTTAGIPGILLLIGLVLGLLILILLLILVSMSNCGTIVHTTAAFCPHCRFLLSPSESGLHLRATPPPSIAPQPQANYMQPPVAPASSISDLPTVEFSPSNGSMNSEATLPYNIQQLQGRNLSLAVGHLTDPGIKRKHKPNEDSLFAMQGSRTYNSLPQEFGLFVVADGMGGHANGQHASRMAIQTIIDYMLPKISMKNQMDEEALLNLLCEGVQRANQAVHQRNLEERADMGTTMTAALVVGATAYVANVGDSRTYLYREPEGLTKITHDHSVVASLVEAGIIKPDDIYTHPKRNQIYRSLGEKLNVDVDSFRVPLQPGDKLLLCSDGLWDMVRDPEIQRLMSLPTPDPAKIGKDLIQAALNGGGEDNVSVIVVSFSEAPDTNQAGMTGVQLLAKPETVTVPDLPLM